MGARTLVLALARLLPVVLATGSSAEVISLQPTFLPGDAYQLSLNVETDLDVSSGGSEGRAERKRADVSYRAAVFVLDVNRKGRAVRERHEDVRLDVERSKRWGSLLEDGDVLVVHRDPGGEVRIYRNAYRARPMLERVLTQVLATQVEYSAQLDFLDPKRPVEIDATWTLDPEATQRFLSEKGLRVIRMGGEPATATLVQLPGRGKHAKLAIDYRVPVGWAELEEMPAGTRAARSDALVTGRLLLGPDPRHGAVGASTDISLHLEGVRTTRPGMSQPISWRLDRTYKTRQRLVMTEQSPFAEGMAAARKP